MMTSTPPNEPKTQTNEAKPEQATDAPDAALAPVQDGPTLANLAGGTHIPPEPIKAPVAVGLVGLGMVFAVGAWKPFIPHAEEGTAAAY
jgi:hypothetical protein